MTNKSILSDDLLDVMQESFEKSAKYLDIETIRDDKDAKTKERG